MTQNEKARPESLAPIIDGNPSGPWPVGIRHRQSDYPTNPGPHQGIRDMTANHPAHPVIWDKTVECTGLTKREWLMAHFPMSIDSTADALRRNGIKNYDAEILIRTHANYARIWADAIIKEAARDE